jgi:hypothetical protein
LVFRNMTRYLFILLIFLTGGLSMAHADDASRLATARQVVEVSRATDNMRRLFPTIIAQIKPALEKQGATREQVDELLGRFSLKLESGLPDFVDLVAQAYAGKFTDEELSALLAFYKSPTGQMFIAKQPEMVQAVSDTGQEWGRRMALQVLQEYIVDKTRGK